MKAVDAVRDIIRLLTEIRDELRAMNAPKWYVPGTDRPPVRLWPWPDPNTGAPKPWPDVGPVVLYGCQTGGGVGVSSTSVTVTTDGRP